MGNERFFFGFGSHQQQVDVHARSKKHFNFLIICIYFYLILLNDSFFQPLLCVTLICGDWSDWSISFKAVFVIVSSADLCTAVTGEETAIFNAPTAAPILTST